MRHFLLCVALVALFILLCVDVVWAGNPESPSDNSLSLLTAPPVPGSSWQLHIDGWRLPRLPVTPGIERNPSRNCYTMRTYYMERDDPRSDVTHRVGSTTCAPAADFQVRLVKDPAKNPSH